MNLYDILGVNQNASNEDIKKAYRKLAKQWHPDMHPDDKKAEASEKFKEIQNAFEILSDPSKRRMYDQPQVAYSSIFDQFFNQSAMQGEDGSHIVINCEVALEDVYYGCERELKFNRATVCESCTGEGGTRESCPQCEGRGFETIFGQHMTVQRPCSVCQGAKTSISSHCKNCNGSGFGNNKEEVAKIKILKGTVNGQRITFRGAGNPGRMGGRTGHLIIIILIKEHPIFKIVDSYNLICEVPVSYTQLALGCNIDVPTIEGMVNLKVPAGTAVNSKFRLREKGLDTGKYGRADLYMILKLEMPKNISDEMKSILEQLKDIEEPTENMIKFRKLTGLDA